MVGDTLNATRRSTFLSAPKRTRKIVENGADTLECGGTQKQFHVLEGPSTFINARTDISRKLPEVTGHMSSCAERNEEKEKEDHARLPARMPASRVPKKSERQQQTGAD